MKKLLFGAVLLYAQAALAGKTVCFSDSLDGIPFQYCTQNGAEFDHAHVLWYLHAKGETASTFLDSPYYSSIKATWRLALGVVPPVAIAVSFGDKWTLSDVPSTYVSGAPVLSTYFLKRVMGYVEARAGVVKPTRRWVMGHSMGGYNASLLWLRNPAVFSKAVLGCPGLFTVSKFSSADDRAAYVMRTGAAQASVDNSVAMLGQDEATPTDWARNDPLAMAPAKLSAASPPVLVWFNTGDQFGLAEGAKQLIATAQSRGTGVSSDSNTGTHCLTDSTISTDVAGFLR